MPISFTIWNFEYFRQRLRTVRESIVWGPQDDTVVAHLLSLERALAPGTTQMAMVYGTPTLPWSQRKRLSGRILAIDVLDIATDLMNLAPVYGPGCAELAEDFYTKLEFHFAIECGAAFSHLRRKLRGKHLQEATRIEERFLSECARRKRRKERKGKERVTDAMKAAFRALQPFIARHAQSADNVERTQGLANELALLFGLQDRFDPKGR